MMVQKRALSLCVSAAVTMAIALPAAAQIEEVVVTAQKREESLQDVPIAMQAFTGDTLKELGAGTSADVLNMIPNASLAAQGGSKQNVFIRGVGSADFHANSVGAVGTYLDEVSLNSPFAMNFALYDMERVEVLRGPQNTLFGRNTTGGAITYISRKPEIGGGYNARGEVTYGRFNQLDFEGAVGFDLGSNAAGRIALFRNSRDGVLDNRTLGIDEGEIERTGGRGQFAWEPNEDWAFLLNLHGGTSRGGIMNYKNTGLRDPANPAGAVCDIDPSDQNPRDAVGRCANSRGFVTPPAGSDWEDIYGNQWGREDINTYGFSLRAEWQWRSLTITSITAYDYFDVRYNEDSDGSPETVFEFHQDGEYDQWSQDLRIQSDQDQSIRWMAGFFWFHEEAEYTTTVRRTPAPFAPSNDGAFNILPNTQVYQDNEVFSVYFQAEIDLQEKLKGTLGYRWVNERKFGWNIASVRCAGVGGPPFCPQLSNGTQIDQDVIRSLPTLLDLGPVGLDGDWSEYGARFALDYQVTDDALLYASISRGFKGGGFSVAALQSILGLGAQPVDPEILWAYEVGGKGTWFDGTLQTNGAVFFYRWDNLQAFQPLLDPISLIAVPQLLNVPAAELIGFEFDIQWAPREDWFFQLGYGFTDGQITDPGNIASLNAGNEIPGNPKHTFNAMGRKEFYIGGGTFALQASARYQDDVTYDLLNNPNLSEPGYWNVGARASYAFGPDGRYQIAGWGRNLTGEEVCNGYTSLEGLAESILCIPNLSSPTYGVTASVNWE